MTNLLKKHLYDKTGEFKLNVLASPLFISGLAVKILAAFFFASDYLGKSFIPFLKYYVLSGYENPYTHFYSIGVVDVFPYPNAMLFILSFPGTIFKFFLDTDIYHITHFELFIFHLPILLADIVILVILTRWLKGKEKALLIFYWLSPILFYINYLHGQFDVIPMMLVFLFLYFLFKEKWDFAYIFLGIAIATKIHILILIPFTVVYVWRKRKSIKELIILVLILIVVFVGINNVDIFSKGFQELVFNNSEQFKIFDLKVLFGDVAIYLIPLAYIAVFFHSLTFRFFNRDVFVMFLGFSFGILTLLIPPMPGWYYWVIPFFVYFYVKNNTFSKFNFLMLNIGYFLYLLLTPQSDFFDVFQYVNTTIASIPNMYFLLESNGINAHVLANIAFTFLQAVLLINVIWLYRRGVENSKKSKLYNMPYLIGVAGDSGSGKSTFAQLISNIFGVKNIAVLEGDDMHKWERGDKMWKKYTHLNPKANELHGNLEHALALKQGGGVHRRHYDHDSGRFTFPNKLESKKVVVFEGLHSFYLDQMRSALDLKIFIMPEEQLRMHWKILRDMKYRGYSKKQVMNSLNEREKDSKQFINTQEEYADITISLKSKKDLSAQLGEDIPLEVFMELKSSNNINMDAFIKEVSSFADIEHLFNEKHQLLQIHGKIEAAEIEKISYKLVPELYEIVVTDPKWSPDYNGVMELFICYYMINSLKLNNHE